jgi:hypothetical protein
LPFVEPHPYAASAKAIDILSRVMSEEIAFHRMKPYDTLLAKHQVLRVYALAEPGQQYLVFAPDGEPFALKVEPGDYTNNVWIDTKAGAKRPAPAVTGAGEKAPVKFDAPDRNTDWVLIVRRS